MCAGTVKVCLSLIPTRPLEEMKPRISGLTSVVGDSRPGCEDERAVRGGSKAGESSALLGMLLATDGGVAPAPDASEPPGPAGQGCHVGTPTDQAHN